MGNYDCSGWATRNDIKCSDGRTIRKDAFKHCDGMTVPLVWNHQHNDPLNVLGHALLENRDEGVYTYVKFNETESGRNAKLLVEHGDVTAFSIYANKLKQDGGNVLHGAIREVSLVLAGANPGAYIDNVIVHSDNSSNEEEGIVAAYIAEDSLTHNDEEYEDEDDEIEEKTEEPEEETVEETVEETEEIREEEISHAEKETKEENMAENKEKTVKEVFDELTEEQKTVVYAMIGQALEDAETEMEHSEGGYYEMKHNVFDMEEQEMGGVLTHADQQAILQMAKQSNVGSFKQAFEIYAQENGLMHSDDNVGVFDNYELLFPELELLKKGEPETIYAHDQSWIGPALAKIHKSPFSRIRTRFADARLAELKAKGYQKKGDKKTVMNQINIINRETTPQTIYIKDSLHRDDIIDVTDFDIVAYEWKQMRRILDETMVLAAMVGDGREDDDPDKIKEGNIRPIWKDDEEYTIHYDVDIEKMRKELQGTDTDKHFSENYIYAEAIVQAALYSREKFKGTGTPDFYCAPHMVNVMLLARDFNGRRIYDSKADLAKALNCNSIVEVEHFEGLTRETKEGDTKELLGLFVNLNDYTFGATRGGEITKFEDFDIDFNLQKYMLETRLSGSLYKLKSAIALEKPVNEAAAG